MVWLHPVHAGRVDANGIPDDALRAELAPVMQRLAAESGGSSQCVGRMLVLTEPAQLDAGEIADINGDCSNKCSAAAHCSR
jgi:feruloyl-CoA synthase